MTWLDYSEWDGLSTAEIRARFTHEIHHEKGWTIAAIKVAPDVNVGITRESEDGPVREFHVLNDKGRWNGPSIDVYLPEVTLDDPYGVVAASLGHSSSTTKTLNQSRGVLLMNAIALAYAEALTEEMRPALEVEAAERTALYERAEERRRQRDQQIKKARSRILGAFDGDRVRVRLTDTYGSMVKTSKPVVGKLSGDTYSWAILVGDEVIPVGRLASFERMQGGRYVPVRQTTWRVAEDVEEVAA